jgi:glycosyltransferase involved in cell wall biosynthesis
MPETVRADQPPVVVFAFNRPDKLRRVLTALQNQGLTRLLVYVDGPRNDADRAAVMACRELAQAVRWAETELIFSEENRGSWTQAHLVNQVLQRYPWAIFLEDDCLPVPGFYEFMRRALEHYAAEPRVFSIGGYQHLPPEFFRGYSYSLVSGARFIGWGWATWRDRWQTAWPYFEEYQVLFEDLTRMPEVAGRDLTVTVRLMLAGLAEQNWDMRLILATLWLKKVHLLPVAGLVRNTGLDLSGVHGSLTNALRALLLHNHNIAPRAPQEIAWLEDVTPNCEYIAGVRDFVARAQAMALRRQAERGRVLFHRYVWPRREVVRDLGQQAGAKPARRALLSYITHPFFIPEDDPRYFNHTNIWFAHAMVQVLNRLGYCVDVIHYRDRGELPRRDYDLLIGHGGVNFASLCRQLPPETRKLLFTTTSYWQYNNQQEADRFAQLEGRRGTRLPYDRRIQHGEDAALRLADGVIGLGNRVTQRTYAGFGQVALINGAALYDDTLDWCPKEFDLSRQHYLFFSGPGNVHKGLDLLLEAFSALPQHLWISARMDPDFLRLYARELNTLSNIHLLGWVQPRSRRFYQVMRRCAFSLLPSCSEGQSQSVIECMNQGLVPVVSRETGLDVDDVGLYIKPCTIERIVEIVGELSAWTPQRLEQTSHAARAAAQSEYTQDAFLRRLEQAIRSFL